MPASKFTPGRRARILEAMERGHYAKHAAALAGVGEQTLRDWLERGRRSKSGAYRTFADAFDEAEANGVDRHVGVIADSDDPRVSMDWLGRRHPELYGKTVRNEHTGADGGPLVVKLEWQSGPLPPAAE